jgi:NDP-sugar pyrophosphorylase family protein
MKRARDIIDREIIDDLWGAGYTILPRNRHVDPFFVPPEIIPQGRAYQWMHLVHDKFWIANGWAAVSASRHDGYFMPAGFVGDIEVNGLGLFEKPKFEVDRDRAEQTATAHKQVDDWKEKWGGQFSGETVVSGERTEIGATKTIEDTTKIPRDLTPYIAQIFEERDRLGRIAAECLQDGTGDSEVDAAVEAYKNAVENDENLSKWPAMNALVLPKAIENVRKRITKEASHGDDRAT